MGSELWYVRDRGIRTKKEFLYPWKLKSPEIAYEKYANMEKNLKKVFDKMRPLLYNIKA